MFSKQNSQADVKQATYFYQVCTYNRCLWTISQKSADDILLLSFSIFWKYTLTKARIFTEIVNNCILIAKCDVLGLQLTLQLLYLSSEHYWLVTCTILWNVKLGSKTRWGCAFSVRNASCEFGGSGCFKDYMLSENNASEIL